MISIDFLCWFQLVSIGFIIFHPVSSLLRHWRERLRHGRGTTTETCDVKAATRQAQRVSESHCKFGKQVKTGFNLFQYVSMIFSVEQSKATDSLGADPAGQSDGTWKKQLRRWCSRPSSQGHDHGIYTLTSVMGNVSRCVTLCIIKWHSFA